ncbi:MAG TPA: aminotransferase class I/II-fold pyridoxal phosphate-dependent enzyme [Edaphobacter sp.]|uniref:pyridoxal phosphate-dependent aminotransferase n=1 Tax=Edaphobacter sp. TaxID=1934404 RepID=UPI002C684151|nr:aminotransferase class I/II-fold pyridoxal phosphate-dependent enzyme [Edaphobacter sp.]HUZ94395.1 aminotransferase class I/II-fold pyridoxal phosphate-dependent enzyme [Edaphobacter sp.]
MPSIPSNLRVSQISPLIIQSEIRSMSVECDRVGGINLAQGICDTDLPASVADQAIEAIRTGQNIYTRLDGIAPLRQAIAAKLLRHNKIKADPDSEILVTSGATGALYATSLALLNPGDEVILFEPFYGYHVSSMLSMRVKPVIVPLAPPDWQLNLHTLRQSVTSRTRAIILNTPSNPSGKVFSAAELQSIADLAIEHDLFVITDEIYEYFLFDGNRHISIATLPGMADRTITVSGLSKTFSITGWRVGYLTASAKWIPSIGYFHDLTYICSPAPLQCGSVAGLTQLSESFYESLSTEYQQKRDQLCRALTEAGLPPSVPAGAYYILADVSRLPGDTAHKKARNLLAATGVAAVAGTAFFADGRGENTLRFFFGKKPEALDRACEALKNLG